MGRKDYWLRVVVMSIIVPIVLSIVVSVLAMFIPMLIWVLWIYAIVISIFATIWTFKRFEDVGFNGFLIIIGLIPYVGSLFVLIVTLLPSNYYNLKN